MIILLRETNNFNTEIKLLYNRTIILLIEIIILLNEMNIL